MRKCVCSRAFLMSFFCTVLVLLFVFGMLMVDAEGRRLSFNAVSYTHLGSMSGARRNGCACEMNPPASCTASQ